MKRTFLYLIVSILNFSVIIGQVCPDRIDCGNARYSGPNPENPGWYFDEHGIAFYYVDGAGSEIELDNTMLPTPINLSLVSLLSQEISGSWTTFRCITIGGDFGAEQCIISTCTFEDEDAFPESPRTLFTGYVEYEDQANNELRRCYYDLGILSDPCSVEPNSIYCETGDFDNDGILNGDDPNPEDPCLPNPNSVACDEGDNDQDGVANNIDEDPEDPCVPNANASACLNIDTDNDGYPDIVDPQPNNPNWPVEIISLTCMDLIEECPGSLMSIINEAIGMPSECIQWNGSCSTTGQLFRQGNVSLGTSVFKDNYAFIVKGGILTEQFKICTTGWCDYVFYKNYPLLSLQEVELFVKTNFHLPKIPSEKELLEEGAIDLGEITRLQQEKLEEAYLHLFNIDEKISKIETHLSNLEQD